MKSESLGRRLGHALAMLLGPMVGDAVRASYAAKYGICRSCARPLAGASPSQICESCHASEVLSAMGGEKGGDA